MNQQGERGGKGSYLAKVTLLEIYSVSDMANSINVYIYIKNLDLDETGLGLKICGKFRRMEGGDFDTSLLRAIDG